MFLSEKLPFLQYFTQTDVITQTSNSSINSGQLVTSISANVKEKTLKNKPPASHSS